MFWDSRGFHNWWCRPVSLCSVIIGLLSIDHLYIFFWPNFLETKFWHSSYPIRGLLKKTKIGNEIIVMGSTFTSNQSFESIFVDLILSLGLKVFPFKKKSQNVSNWVQEIFYLKGPNVNSLGNNNHTNNKINS